MLKYTLSILSLFLCFFNSVAQNTQDTINNPYWIQMMQSPTVNLKQTQRAFELYWSNKTVQKGSGWKAFKRWEYLSSKLVDSLGYFPNAGIQFQDLQNKIDADNRFWQAVSPGIGPGTAFCRNQGNWKSIGPNSLPINNTGQMNGMGRVNAIGLHPTDSNIIFIGSAAGGIWKTTDGGNTWTVNSDSLPTLGVSAIAITPSNPSVMYFGSGDRDAGDAAGFGVFKSTNAGLSWTISNSGMGNRKVARLIIDPNNVNVLLAATDNGIYRSVNAGITWTQTFNGGFFKDIIFKPNNSKVVYATKDGLFYRSLDNGVNWTNLSNGLPTTSISRAVIEVNAKDPKMVYFWIATGSVHKGIYLSRDSGNFFRTQSTTPNLHDYSTNGSGSSGQAWYDMDMVSDPSNQAILYCGGVNVFKSTDTGKTWTIAGYWVNQIHADQHELAASPITNKIFAGNDGGFYASRNKGGSWQAIGSGLGIAQIYKLGASRTVKNILINGFQDNGTANYNKNWYTTYGGDGMDCEIDQTDARYSFGELYYGSIFRIFNLNAQATIANNGYIAAGSDTINESGAWVTPFTLREGSGNTMFIGYKNIWRSNNIKSSTVTWKKISNNLGANNSSDFNELESNIANSDILYAARSNGTFYRSDNVNASSPTWTSITLPISGVVNAIETDPKNANIVYISIGNKVYKSSNKGSTWQQILSNFSYNVSSILLDTSNNKKGIYVATMGGGVWYSDTTQSSWRYYSKGLPNTANITDLEMYYEPNKLCNCHILYGSTYNRGNFYTTIFNDGNQKPVALLDPYDTVVCRSSVLTFNSKSCNNPTRFKWSFSPNSISFINGSDSTSENPSIKFTNSGIFKYKFMAENCNGIDTLSGFITVGDTAKKTCIPTTTNNFGGLGIFNVSISNINRSSGDRSQEGPYVDVSCAQLIKVKRGKKYALKVTTGQYNNEQVKAFIDFNNNGLLTDAGELVYQPAAALINHLDTIYIPNNATVGSILRMRIRSDFNSIGTNPCSNLSYGQTEDYGLFIEPELQPKFTVNKSKVCPNNLVVFTDSSNLPGLKYLWNFGVNAQPQVAYGIGPHQVYFKNFGYQSVTLNIDGKISKRDSAVLVYKAPNIKIDWVKGDSMLCIGMPFSLKASDLNNSNPSFQWRFNSVNIKDSINQFLRIKNGQLKDSGYYSVIASNQCKDTAEVHLKIKAKPLVNFTVNDSTQCQKNHVFLSTNLSSMIGSGFKSNWVYSDSHRDSNLNSSHSFNTYGQFWVKLICYSPYNCKDSLVKPLEVFENPVADFTIIPSAQCFKNNQTLFSNKSTLNTSTLNSNWNFGDAQTSSLNNPNLKSYSVYDSSYKVKLTVSSINLCTDSITKMIQFYPQTRLNPYVSDSVLCEKMNLFNLSDNSSISNGSFSIQWDLGDGSFSNLNSLQKHYANKGTYQMLLSAVTNHLCRDTVYRKLVVLESPRAQFTVNDTMQCLNGNNFILNDQSVSNLVYSRKWYQPELALSNANTHSFSRTDTGSFEASLFVLNSVNCSDSISKRLYVAPLPEFVVAGPRKSCLNDSITFTINGSSNNAYQWTVDQIQLSTGLQLKYFAKKIGFHDFEVKAISPFKCVNTKTLSQFLKVNDLPQVKFKDSVSFADPQLLLTFTDISNIPVQSRNWYFSNGLTGSNKTESFLLKDSSHILAKLVITDSNACTSEKSQLFYYKSNFYIPNIFSPNNDGKNDVFKIYGLFSYQSFKMKIFNRWGEMIFYSENPQVGWNGFYKDQLVMPGDYFYQIEIQNVNSTPSFENGTVLLIR